MGGFDADGYLGDPPVRHFPEGSLGSKSSRENWNGVSFEGEKLGE